MTKSEENQERLGDLSDHYVGLTLVKESGEGKQLEWENFRLQGRSKGSSARPMGGIFQPEMPIKGPLPYPGMNLL